MARAVAEILLKANTEGVAGSLRQVTSQFQRFGNSVESIGRTLSTVGSIIGITFGVEGVRRMIESADAFKSLEARIRGITAETGDFERVSEAVRQISRETGAPLETTVSVFQSLARSRNDLGATNDQMLTLTKLVQQLGVIGGASTGALNAGLLQFSQAMSGGIVRAEEWNSILENLPELANAIAQGMGKSTGELRKMVISGQLLSRDVFEVLIGQAGEIDARFAQMPVTAERGWNAFEQSLTRIIGKIDQAAGITDFVGRGLQGWANYLDPTEEQLNLERLNELADRRRELAALPLTIAGRPNPAYEAERAELAAIELEMNKLNEAMLKKQQLQTEAGDVGARRSVAEKLRLADEEAAVKSLTGSYQKLVQALQTGQEKAKAGPQKDIKDATVLDINRLRDQALTYLEQGKNSEDFKKALPLLQRAQQINDALLEQGKITTPYYQTQAALLLELAQGGRAILAGEQPGVALGIDQVASQEAATAYLEISRQFWAQNPAYQPVIPVPAGEAGTAEISNAEGERVTISAAGLAGGGLINGPGSGTSDSILARLSNGEFVLRAAAVNRYGLGLLSAMNRLSLPKFAGGGLVGAAAGGGGVAFTINLDRQTLGPFTGGADSTTQLRAALGREVLKRGRR